MSIDEAIRILENQIGYWETRFWFDGRYPEGYSPELSDAMVTVVEAHGKEKT